MSESLGLTKQQTKNLMKFISDNISMPVLGAGGGFAPIGTLNYYMGTVAPQGWLICDGTVYDIADYPEFATFIASNYGSTNAFGGDGITTFAVPDCRGEFARMIGTNSHANQGSGGTVGQHQDGTTIPRIINDTTYHFEYFGRLATSENRNVDSTVYSSTPIDQVSTNVYTQGSATPAEITTRPTNTSWNFIVKATISDSNPTPEQYHVYTPNEHVVGEWQEMIDGVLKKKPVYERTITKNSMSATDGDVFDATFSRALTKVIKAEGSYLYGSDTNNALRRFLNYGYIPSKEVSGKIEPMIFQHPNGLAYASDVAIYDVDITAQYTKSTDTWVVV